MLNSPIVSHQRPDISVGDVTTERYLVTVYYREPTYELFSGAKAEPYHWTFEVEADDVEAAKRESLRQFRELASVSSVGWIRRIVSVRVVSARAGLLQSA
jgi:hypothetical protein